MGLCESEAVEVQGEVGLVAARLELLVPVGVEAAILLHAESGGDD
jgi:hypothetical protein